MRRPSRRWSRSSRFWYPDALIDGRIFNAGYENHPVRQLAEIVRDSVARPVEIATLPSDDQRSYHVSSERIGRELGFVPRHTIEDAVASLGAAFAAGRVAGAMTDERYYNVKRMRSLGLG